VAAVGGSAAGDGQGNAAEDKGQRGHDDGAQAHFRRLDGGVIGVESLFALQHGELDDQNGVFRGQGNQRDEADLEVDVVFLPSEPDGQEGAADGERHG